MKKGFVFDLDGVITDTAVHHYRAWKALSEKIGIEIDPIFNEKLKGISRMESLERILVYGGKARDYTQEEKVALAEEKNGAYVKSLQGLSSKDLLPGVSAFFQQVIKKGVPCSLASASMNAPFILEKLGLSEYFNGIVDPKTLTKNKPDPEIFIKGAEIISIKPWDAVGFEDAQAGIEAIKKAGMYAVGIVTSEPLEQADLSVRRLDELSVEALLEK